MSTSDRIAATLDSALTTTPNESPDSKALKWAGAIVVAPTPLGHAIGLWIIIRGFFRWSERRQRGPIQPSTPTPLSARKIKKIKKHRAKLRQAMAEGRTLPMIIKLPDDDSDLLTQ